VTSYKGRMTTGRLYLVDPEGESREMPPIPAFANRLARIRIARLLGC
jgi:hypothetical protein